MKIQRGHTAKQPDHAEGIAQPACLVVDRGCHRAQANLIFAVFERIAPGAGLGKLRKQAVGVGDGVAGVGDQAAVEHPTDLRLGAAREQQLALGRSVQRQGRAGFHRDLQARACGGHRLVKGDGVALAAQRQKRAAAGLGGQLFQIGMRQGGDIPGPGHRTAVLIQADAEAVGPVGVLTDHIILPQGGEQTVDRAFRVAAALLQLLQGHGAPVVEQQAQKLHGLAQRAHAALGLNGRRHRNPSSRDLILLYPECPENARIILHCRITISQCRIGRLCFFFAAVILKTVSRTHCIFSIRLV